MNSTLHLNPERFFPTETRARGMDCSYLAELVATHRLDEDEAAELAVGLPYRLPKAAYRL